MRPCGVGRNWSRDVLGVDARSRSGSAGCAAKGSRRNRRRCPGLAFLPRPPSWLRSSQRYLREALHETDWQMASCRGTSTASGCRPDHRDELVGHELASGGAGHFLERCAQRLCRDELVQLDHHVDRIVHWSFLHPGTSEPGYRPRTNRRRYGPLTPVAERDGDQPSTIAAVGGSEAAARPDASGGV
jgi:hypothetical protein